jgi:membrane-bound lytic murein transglycosylase A
MKTVIFLLAIFTFCASAEVTPTVKVNASINFSDDLDFSGLEMAIDRQIVAYDANGLDGTIKFGKTTYSKKVLKESLLSLKDIATASKECIKRNPREKCLNEFNANINENFTIYRPFPGRAEKGRVLGSTHFTSYYSPDLSGSMVKTARFNRPIYKIPDNVADQNYSRVDIDFHGILDGKGLELFWVEDSFYDLYLFHVQGGGRIKIQNEDGTFKYKYLSYAGKNSRPFQMIYHYMIEKGYLTKDTSIPAQRKFLDENPDKLEEIFGSSPSYIYFKVTEDEPVGLDNIPLTEGRSLALDVRIYKTTGLINFIKTVKPTLDNDGKMVKVPFARFFIAQDTGGAIRGNARCDLYAGYGHMAELMAYNTDELGEQYFLIKK